VAMLYNVRCSILVVRKHAALLVHRTCDGLDDWVLPGGTPCEGESLTACARRELLEETGVSADPSRVAFVVESASPGAGRMLDIVFVASGPVLSREYCREPGMGPSFLSADQLSRVAIRPAITGQLIRLLDPGRSSRMRLTYATGRLVQPQTSHPGKSQRCPNPWPGRVSRAGPGPGYRSERLSGLSRVGRRVSAARPCHASVAGRDPGVLGRALGARARGRRGCRGPATERRG
jgi:8-oxo-dGTP diphosphatase